MKRILQNMCMLFLILITATYSYSQHKTTVTDIDGNVYPIVEIGTQKWMGENLRVAKFNNGDAIPNIQSVVDWTSESYPLKWVNYDNDPTKDAVYGKLYDGRVATDERNVCPDGWHVATKDEWDEMFSYLGGVPVAANKLMDNSGNYWETPNNATNETGFSAVPNGYRASDGSFLSLPYASEIWTSTKASSMTNNYVSIHYSGNIYSSDGMPYGVGRAIRCVKNAEASIPGLTTTSITNITQTTASSGGNITDNGGADVTTRGVCWSTSQNPTVSDTKTENGTGAGEFTSNLTGLTANTTYYLRAYATNSAGTGYGEQKEFTTSPTPVVPTLTTTTITSITRTTASSGGNITDNGGTEVTARGVCWSTTQTPTVTDSKTENGTGVGEFTSNLTGLAAHTTYYVRAYATNSAGTGYGNEVQFTTSNIEPFTEPEWVHLHYENSPIPSGYGIAAQEDSKGNILLASSASITKYTPEGQMVNYENSAATSDYSSFVLENDNTMWVCNRTDGVFKFDGQGNWTQYNTENTSMISNYIHSIAIDSKGNKWITTNNGGLVKYDGANWTVYTKENSDLPANSIYSIFIDKNDNVWLGLSGYLVKFDGTTWSIWTSSETDNGVGGVISAIAINESDNIWIGKDWNLGVAKASLSNLTLWTKYNYNNSDYPESRSVAIDFDADGRVWFGTDSKGLAVFDGSTWYTYNSTNSNWPVNDWVRSIFKDSKENTWMGSLNGFVLIGQYVPTVSTKEVSNITQTSALSGGTIVFYGGADITAKGVVWSTSEHPTITDSKTEDGAGVGEFTSNLTNLTANTKYYVRAYATSSAGTGYGEQKEFTTEKETSTEPLPLPFFENFDGEIHSWIVLDLDDDGNEWGFFENTAEAEVAYSGTICAGVKYNPSGNNDWLITPLLTLPADEEIEFSFWAKSQDPSYLESFDIQISTDGGENFTKVGNETDISASYTKYSYDLSEYAGQNLHIAVVCISVDRYFILVDDISCAIKESTSSPIIPLEFNVKAYPNPFANNLTVESDKGMRRIVITNINGQVLMQKHINGEISKQINTEKLGSGLYLLQVIDINGNSKHIKLVKP